MDGFLFLLIDQLFYSIFIKINERFHFPYSVKTLNLYEPVDQQECFSHQSTPLLIK